jgi:hypothetical protein
MRRRFLLLVGLCGLLAGGCAGTVEGSGTVARDAVRPGGAAAKQGRPANRSHPAPTGRATLKCSGTVISPAGAPYCFSVPAGFQDMSASVSLGTSIGRGDKFRSAVAVGRRDLIVVSVYEVATDTDKIADDTIEGELKTVLAQLGREGFTFESTSAERSTVDGARSFGYRATQAKDGLQSHIFFLVRGRNEIQVTCQWTEQAAEVQKGCQAVLRSLQFRSVK